MAKPSPSLHWNEVISKTASGDTTVALPGGLSKGAPGDGAGGTPASATRDPDRYAGAYPGVESEARTRVRAGSVTGSDEHVAHPIVSAVIGEGAAAGRSPLRSRIGC